ncbi:MAG: hypothetical protein COA66_03055 [Arcobacter sp.]|nr:MAG: hypothetical protein COA66_03055 [Arcobacter sp.]
MNYLQYTSKEMISATELVRKSKKVFNSVQKGEIDKAVILRDGKPSFILIDFNKYEEIMSEYMLLKEKNKSKKTNVKNEDELEEKKVQKALKDIEELSDEDNKKDKKELNDFWE